MMFDFTNYTFSGLLSILASIYGIGYPLIIQTIRSIYNQYDSDLLSCRFSKEPVYKVFQILMIVNMVVAILAPFLLQAGWFNQVVITVQAVLVVALIGCSIMLFQLILLFSNAGELLKRVEGEQIDQNNVMEILDIAIYADAQHNLDLYIRSLSKVFSYIQQQQGDQFDQKIDTIKPPAFYDEVTVNIVRKLKEYIRMDDGHHFLYGNNEITSIFYNQTSASRLSLQSHQLMWILLNDAIEFNNHTWFNQYWQYADSYASMKYHFVSYDSPLRHDKQMFMVRHVMIGGMLLHYGRINWLNDVFFFTHSEPEYYGLIPSSFSEIVVMLELIDKMCTDFTYFYQQGFYYHDQMSGVKDNKYFFRDALKYLSLLVIRLWSLEGRGADNTQLFSLPASPLKLNDNERDAQMMRMMLDEVGFWYDTKVFINIPRLRFVDKAEVENLLNKYQQQCEMDKKDKEEHPVVNIQKYQELFNGIETEASRIESILQYSNEYANGKTLSINVIKSFNLETINYSSFKDIDCRCIPYVHFSNYWSDIAYKYLRCLCSLKRLGDFKVPRKQIPNVLKDMGLNGNYAIIATEIIDELPYISVLLNVLLDIKCFFVMKKNEIPLVTLLPIENNKELKPIKKGKAICSNIENFQGYNEPIYELILGTVLRFSTPNDFSGYVRFIIDDTYEAQDVTIKPQKTLGELFGMK